MPALGGDPAFGDDTGAADSRVSGALAALAAGSGGEHQVLVALARSRLLVPVVALAADESGSRPSGPGGSGAPHRSEMATPVLTGQDGRPALPAFTSLDALRRWQPAARPVPAPARAVWQSAVAGSCAVIIDVAGPVPLAVEGGRLAALARGEPVPPPFQDPDVVSAVSTVLAAEAAIAGFQLGEGEGGTDLTVVLRVAGGGTGRKAAELGGRAATAIMSVLGGRLRRGITVMIARS